MKSEIVCRWLLVFLLVPAFLSAEEPPVIDEDLDPAEWGIHNGCIRTSRIKSLRFIDETSALIEISNNKTIMMKLKQRCPGVKNHGISYKTQTGTLCARMDFVTSLQTRFSCQIESFEPYLTLDDPSANMEEDAEHEKAKEDK